MDHGQQINIHMHIRIPEPLNYFFLDQGQSTIQFTEFYELLKYHAEPYIACSIKPALGVAVFNLHGQNSTFGISYVQKPILTIPFINSTKYFSRLHILNPLRVLLVSHVHTDI